MTSTDSWKTQWQYKRCGRSSRLPRVREIRDKALQILSDEGSWTADRSIELKVLWLGISHMTPFHRHSSGLYHLDIWAGPKMLNIEWSGSDEIEIVSFHRGPWEDLLLVEWQLLPSAVQQALPLMWRDFKNVS